MGLITKTSIGNVVTVRNTEREFKRLVTADLSQIGGNPLSPGSWVLTVSSEISENFDDSIVATYLVPLVVRINIGDGGAVVPVEMDAFPGGSIQLPGSCVDVSVGWDPLYFNNAIAGLPAPADQGWLFPEAVRVNAVLKQGNADGIALRSFALDEQNSTSPAIAIPKFAAGVSGFNVDISNAQLYAALTRLNLFTGTTAVGGSTIMSYTGTDLAAAARGGYYLDVPPQANSWNASRPGAVDNLQLISFRLNI